MSDLYGFRMKTIDGEVRGLDTWRGKVLLVVNVASRCGNTPQYAPLERLYKEHGAAGLVVLAFPCNQFGGQEPGTEQEVKTFCESSYGVTFPLFAKIEVNGPKRAPLYAWLTAQPTRPEGPGDIGWNFAKFLVGRDGKVAARFSPRAQPDSPEITEAIRSALGAM